MAPPLRGTCTVLASLLLAAAAAILYFTPTNARQDSPGTPLPAPTLRADPAVAAVQLTWTEPAGAHRYELNFWHNDLTDWQPLGGDNLTGAAFDHNDLTIGVTYYYRIRAVDAGGQASAWSENVYATAHADLAVPELSAQPATGAIHLSWPEVSGAARYDLYYWWEELDDWQRIDGNSLTATTFDHNGLTPGATYYYLMRARNAAGQPGPWTQQLSVTLPGPGSPTPSSALSLQPPTATPTPTPTPTETPQVPVSSHSVAVAGLPAPALSARPGYGAVDLSWDAVEGAARYELQTAATPDGWQPLGGDNLTRTAYIHTGLAVGATYRYRIRALTEAGHPGAWSEQLSVTLPDPAWTPTPTATPTPTPTPTPPLTPTPTPAPSQGPDQTAAPAPAQPQLATSDAPTPIPTSSGFTVPVLTATGAAGAVELRWGAVTGAVRYEIQSWSSPGGWKWIGGDNLTGASFSHTGLSAGVEYFYWIRAVSSSGAATALSEPVSATVLSSGGSTATPTPTADQTGTPTPTLTPPTDQTATPTATSPPVADRTATHTATPAPTANQTGTPAATPTPTADGTATPTATPASGPAYEFVQSENMSAVRVGSTVTLVWHPYPAAIHYNIYYCLSTGNGNSICTAPLFFWSAYETIVREYKATTYLHEDVLQSPSGTPYTHFYVIQACLQTNCPTLARESSTASPTPTPTATPTQPAVSTSLPAPVLSLNVLSDGIEVRWTAVPNAVRYILVTHWDANIGWRQISGHNLTATSFIHKGYVPGAKHNYSVRAVSAAGEVSPWSNYPFVTAPASAPSGSAPTPPSTLTPTPTHTPSPTPTVSARVASPPHTLNTYSYYSKYLDAGGVPILSSHQVSDEELYQTRTTMLAMLSDRSDLHGTMAAYNMRLLIYPDRFEYGSLITDLPEFRGSGLTYRTIGAAGRTPLGWVAAAPEVARHCNHVMIHEIAHLIEDALRLQPGGDEFLAKLNSAYQAAMLRGLWQDRYAATNALEYWAELVRTWLTPSQFAGWLGPGYHKLEDYDPVGAALVKEVMGNPTPLTFCEIRRFDLRGTVSGPSGHTPMADSYILQLSMRSPAGGKRLYGTSTAVRRSDGTFAFERLIVENHFLSATGVKPHIVIGIYRYDSASSAACPAAAFLGSDGTLLKSTDSGRWQGIQVTGNDITGLSITIPPHFDWTPLHQCI
ncbi:MAG: fibronectin type III domain-containing protein [Caldilineaceae bacterium]|nr:fibronectin type III domain-containing protein [Caldilineaceae bacterium]